ncbi:MAG: imidazole glycerol phosphate synthase subunit HisH [Magnetococcus sp. DMHC-6]
MARDQRGIMNNKVTIIDYGAGNLLSVRRAFEHFGAQVTIADTHSAIDAADRLVLPGVGAFGKGMEQLQKRRLIWAIQGFATLGRPLLGICLGMQMLLEESEEFGTHAGLGLIPGRVVALPKQDKEGKPLCIPHIGWNGVLPLHTLSDWQKTALEGTKEGENFYFVHSFQAQPTDPTHGLAHCLYGGLPVCAVIHRDNLTGCQFHPEKSGKSGLRVIQKFLQS